MMPENPIIETLSKPLPHPYDYDTGIEKDDEPEGQMDPFDPEEISIESKVVPMETFLRRLQQGTIILNPDFQRNEVWTPDRRSQLIESMMLRIPLPMFYVSADERNNFTVVDGLQRLSTIRKFVLGDAYMADKKDESKKGYGFPLQDLEFWKTYDGLRFAELPVNIRNRILETEFNFTIINPGTPEEVRRNIFKRLNTGGMPLSSQEIRNALYLGKATKLLNEMAEFPAFKAATNGSIRSLRMEDRELILRFVSFLIRDFSTYRKTVSVDTYLSNTMIILNAMPNLDTKELQKMISSSDIQVEDINRLSEDTIKAKFKLAMERALKLFGEHAFRKSAGSNGRRTPINKALFETWGVVLAKMEENDFQRILKDKRAFGKECHRITIANEYAFSRDSMQNYSVNLRFGKFLEVIHPPTQLHEL